MKRFILLFSIFGILLTGNSYADDDDYNICATNANGAILVEQNNSDHHSFALASSPTDFTVVMGDNANQGGMCEVTPDNYKFTIFKMGLCKENPWTGFDDNANNTKTADLSTCTDIFDVSAGKEVNLTPGSEVNLLDDGVILPIGSFPYIYALLDNAIQVKHIQEFAVAPGADDFIINGYDTGDESSGGKFCYTGLDDNGDKFVMAKSNDRSFGTFTTLRGGTYKLPEHYNGDNAKAKFHCGTEAEANAANDFFVTLMNSMGDEMTTGNDGSNPGAATGRTAANFRNASENSRGFHKQFPTIAQYYYLFNANDSIATSPATVEKILFIQDDTSNIINITEDTTAFKLNFKTNNAVEIGIFESITTQTRLQATEMQANSIFVNIQTKTRKSGDTFN
ncbi:hypothetical protein IDH19_04455 [Pelagibacterales bacterium SAG-MED48]|nr:hypothetical protein [Pelagibacterales bacterium SAG-MED48]